MALRLKGTHMLPFLIMLIVAHRLAKAKVFLLAIVVPIPGRRILMGTLFMIRRQIAFHRLDQLLGPSMKINVTFLCHRGLHALILRAAVTPLPNSLFAHGIRARCH